MITRFKKLLHLVAPVVITLWHDDTLLEAIAFVSVTSVQFLHQNMDLNQFLEKKVTTNLFQNKGEENIKV